ncbi:hypothetical protein D3C73_1514890 [compost metagenome]
MWAVIWPAMTSLKLTAPAEVLMETSASMPVTKPNSEMIAMRRSPKSTSATLYSSATSFSVNGMGTKALVARYSLLVVTAPVFGMDGGTGDRLASVYS